MKVTDIKPEDISLLWPLVEKYVAEGLKRSQGEYTPEDMQWLLEQGLAMLWVVYNEDNKICAAMVCEIVEWFGRKKVCYILAFSGHGFHEWKHHLSAIEAWAQVNGADSIQAMTRPGLVKAAKDFGYKPGLTAITKDLEQVTLH